MARFAKLIALILLINVLSCTGNQYADPNLFKSQIVSLDQEINQLNEKMKQVNAGTEIAETKERSLTGSMKQEELSIYEQLKASRLQQNVVQYTQLLEVYKNYLNANYPPARATNRLNNVISVLTEINNNYIKKYQLTTALEQRHLEIERLRRDIAVNTTK